ncbi:9270_t:CDS:2 [Gigaspora rosea]|nr:9270_t:CDS:2 [Gigaspora rosea]
MSHINATLVCIFCQKRHERCERLPEEKLNNEQNITSSSDSFSTMYLMTPYFFETQPSYNNIITTTPNIDICSNDDSFFFETPFYYYSNINSYGSVEHSNLKSSAHDEPMPNDE